MKAFKLSKFSSYRDFNFLCVKKLFDFNMQLTYF